MDTVPGVLELYGDEARKFRHLVRTIEDTLDSRGFQELNPGLLATDRIFRENVNHLGARFMENLVYVSLNGEKNVVVLPEGTMRTYDFMKRKQLLQARIFYSQPFVRNEPPTDVAKGKTRNFWQIGYELLGQEWLSSSLDAMETAHSILADAGLKDVRIRFGDGRLMKGLLARVPSDEREKVLEIIQRANDDPQKFLRLYQERCVGVDDVAKEIASFMGLMSKVDLSLSELSRISSDSLYQEGIAALNQINEALSPNVNRQILPFLGKSWNACDRLIFDARVEDCNGAIAGGGNLTYRNYLPEVEKSGAGIGITRVFQVLKQRGKI